MPRTRPADALNTTPLPRSLRNLMLAVAGGLLLVSAFVVLQLQQGLARAEASAEQSAQRLALSMESFLLGHVLVVDQVLQTAADEFSRSHARGDFSAAGFTAYLDRQRAQLATADALRATNAQGQVSYGSGLAPGQVINNADRPYFIEARDSSALVIGLPVRSRVTQRWVLPMARALRTPDGQFAGVVYAFLNTDRIAELFASLALGRSGVMTLFDAQRRVLLRHPATPQTDGAPPQVLSAPATLAAMAAGRSEATYRTASSIDGVDRTLTYRRVGSYPLYVITGVARDDYLAAWRREALVGALLLLALCSTAAALSLLLLRAWRGREQALRALQQQGAALQDTVTSLRSSEARFRTLTDALPQLVWTTTAEGRLDLLSQQWLDFSGISLARLREPAEHRHLMHPDDRDRAFADWNRARATGTRHSAVLRLRRHDGVWRVFDSRALPQHDADGRLRGWVGTLTDITEAREAHDALLAGKQAADEANRAKSAFLAMMSHEMRTPLNGVMGFAHLGLRDAGTSAQTQQRFTRILESAQLLLNLIDDLLDLSKIEAGKLALVLTPIDLPPLMARTVDLLRERARTQGIALTLTLTDRVPQQVVGDALRLQQVAMNLVSNAVKFTDAGAVTVQLDRDGDELVLVVQDTGVGMSAEQLGRLYRPFEQADQDTSRRYGGTGLGLAITQRLVQLMGGRIGVSSRLGEGSRFEVRLPVQPPAPPTRAGSPEPALDDRA